MSNSSAPDLGQKTLDYWRVSKCFYGRSNERITTAQAIKLIQNTFYDLDPHRSLFPHICALKDAVIHGKVENTVEVQSQGVS